MVVMSICKTKPKLQIIKLKKLSTSTSQECTKHRGEK